VSLRTITVFGGTEVEVHGVSFRRCRHGKDSAICCTPRSKCSTSYPVLLLPSTHRCFSTSSAYFSFFVFLSFISSFFYSLRMFSFLFVGDEAARWAVRGLSRGMGKGFSPSTKVQTGSATHAASASYSLDTWIFFLGGESSGA
jgi:hypothetical protein